MPANFIKLSNLLPLLFFFVSLQSLYSVYNTHQLFKDFGQKYGCYLHVCIEVSTQYFSLLVIGYKHMGYNGGRYSRALKIFFLSGNGQGIMLNDSSKFCELSTIDRYFNNDINNQQKTV